MKLWAYTYLNYCMIQNIIVLQTCISPFFLYRLLAFTQRSFWRLYLDPIQEHWATSNSLSAISMIWIQIWLMFMVQSKLKLLHQKLLLFNENGSHGERNWTIIVMESMCFYVRTQCTLDPFFDSWWFYFFFLNVW